MTKGTGKPYVAKILQAHVLVENKRNTRKFCTNSSIRLTVIKPCKQKQWTNVAKLNTKIINLENVLLTEQITWIKSDEFGSKNRCYLL